MNKPQKKITRLAKKTRRDTDVAFRRARKVARDCYRILDEVNREEEKQEREKRRL